MRLLKRKTSPVDLSNSLWALRNKITKDQGLPFNFNSHQDDPEILKIETDELKGISQVADNIQSTLQRSVTSNNCLCCNIQEEKLDIITFTKNF